MDLFITLKTVGGLLGAFLLFVGARGASQMIKEVLVKNVDCSCDGDGGKVVLGFALNELPPSDDEE
ncbi:H/ACA ribonucleoprotein complex subunit 3-like protein [Sesbania bispinosa]|nr:H/ACA ribonucleoprotein complex subunit 3-like protein [Sesbania bispinosa]